MLVLDDISVRVAGRLLLDGASARIPEDARVGLVGRNGIGKTTLFRAIAGEIGIEHGGINMPARARIGRLAQEAPSGPERLIDVVLAADTERTQLLAEAETARDPHRIAEIQTRLADIGAHAAPARAAAILAGLGFDEAAQQRPCTDFSGGWRMRVALAAVLFSEPDLLLLDEPTNYLDLEGTLWLTDHLARYPRTAIIISHDRDLLDDAVAWILHIDSGTLARISVGCQPDKPVLRRLTFRIDTDDCIALLGPNGNGKSTLAKLLAGRLAPIDGAITRPERLPVAYFAQHQLDELVPTQSVFAHVRRLMPDAPEAKVRARAGGIGFTRERADA